MDDERPGLTGWYVLRLENRLVRRTRGEIPAPWAPAPNEDCRAREPDPCRPPFLFRFKLTKSSKDMFSGSAEVAAIVQSLEIMWVCAKRSFE